MGLSTTNADDGPFQLGEIVEGRYRILRLVGAGGIGRVYEAEHNYVGRHVALKALYNKAGDHHERMRLEARALAKIRHPNVVPVMDGGVTRDGVVWFAMPLLEGRTLRQELWENDALGVERALRYGAQIARGLAEAHRTGLVHRDLKPENVFLVSSEDSIRVLDFGTSKFERGSLKTTDRFRVMGTNAYMSPERVQAGKVDLRADIYALGHILFEMLTGRHALSEGPGPLDLPPTFELGFRQIYADVPAIDDYAPGTPAYVQSIVYQALAKDRDSRQPSMDVVADQLETARARYLAASGERREPALEVEAAAPEPGPKQTLRPTGRSAPAKQTLRPTTRAAPVGAAVSSPEDPAQKKTVRLVEWAAQHARVEPPNPAPALVTERISAGELSRIQRLWSIDAAPGAPPLAKATADREPPPVPAAPEGSQPSAIEPPLVRPEPFPKEERAPDDATPLPSTGGELRIEADLVVGAASFALAPADQESRLLPALFALVASIGSDHERLGMVQSMLVGVVHSPESSRGAVRRDIETWAEANGHGDELRQQKIESRLLAFGKRWHEGDSAEIEIDLAKVAHGAALILEPSLRLDAAETALAALSDANADIYPFALGVLIAYARAAPSQRPAARGALLAMLLGGPEDSELARETLAGLMMDTVRRSAARKRRRAERASAASASRSLPSVDRRQTVEHPEARSQPEPDAPPCLPTVESARAPEAPRFIQTPPRPGAQEPAASRSTPSRRPTLPRRQFWLSMAAAAVCAMLVVVVAKLTAPVPASTPAPSARTVPASHSTATRASALPATSPVTSDSPRPSASPLASAGAPSKPAPSAAPAAPGAPAAPAASARTRPTRAAAHEASAPTHVAAPRARPASRSAPARRPRPAAPRPSSIFHTLF